MAKDNGKSLVIVESPAKAKTIARFLGDDYAVEASIGHVRDLPKGKKQVPEKYKDEEWASLGVNVDEGFEPIYIVPPDKKKQVTKLRGLLKEAKQLYLATDEDREGEAISWHLHELLKPKVPVHRLVFHEITKEAIETALANPRDIDNSLVRAQETRRILDRLFGYEVSPLLWRKVGGNRLSAGRVQSVAVRLIVERERLRIAFHSATYWDLLGQFASAAGKAFIAGLVSMDGRKIPSGKDFDSATGQLKNDALLLWNEQDAQAAAEKLGSQPFTVSTVTDKPDSMKPYPPFTTSTLQQEANRQFNFTARHTMRVAQDLYENGYITYMRTDSTHLAKEAVEAARDLIQSQYGGEYLPDQPRKHHSKVKNAQEAHEAIRPAGHPFRLPESLKGELSTDQFRLFQLIWKRTVASQMVDARLHRTTIALEGGGAVFQVSGKRINFPGFLRAYVEGSDDPQAELADKESVLPDVQEGEQIDCRQLEPKSHTTQPPARYTEASLTKKLEEMGIGRPSTYASIIDTILEREYVFKKGSALAPTWIAFTVVRLLEDHLESLVDYEFTAKMEDYLDSISRHEAEHHAYLKQFYFGEENNPGLKQKVKEKIEEIDRPELCQFVIGRPSEGEHTEEIVVRVFANGSRLEQAERKASIPEKLAPDELTIPKALELLEQAAKQDEPLGQCPQTGRDVFLKIGRYGPYVQLGPGPEGEKEQNASLLKNMTPADVDLATALKLLSLPRTVGEHPQSKQPITAANGRYGPYIKCEDETRSLPDDISPLDVTLEQALDLLAQPKKGGRRRSPAKEPLKVFEASPLTGEPIQLLDGFYGPYVTDGENKKSVPKGTKLDEITFDQAVEWLAERAAAAPAKKKKTAKKKKAAPKKTTAKKKTAKKKAAKKTTKSAKAEKSPVKKKTSESSKA